MSELYDITIVGGGPVGLFAAFYAHLRQAKVQIIDSLPQLDQEVLDDDLVLPIENGEIDLAESVSDNILLNIPIKVLTAEEEAGQGFVSGNDWQIMSEEEYQAQQAVKKEENSPFAGLQGLFDGDE